MGIQHMTYLDIPLEKRAKAAKEARAKVKALMANPFLTPEQGLVLKHELARIDKWERGERPIGG